MYGCVLLKSTTLYLEITKTFALLFCACSLIRSTSMSDSNLHISNESLLKMLLSADSDTELPQPW